MKIATRDESDDATLAELRSQIRRLDESIVALIAERVALCIRIGKHKQRKGLAVRDPAVEARVIANARLMAVTCGLATDVAESVLRILIDHSVAAQLEQRCAVVGACETEKPDGSLSDW